MFPILNDLLAAGADIEAKDDMVRPASFFLFPDSSFGGQGRQTSIFHHRVFV
jgi:hypothetical protein